MSAQPPQSLRFYSFLSRFGLLRSYRAKIMVMAFIGTHVPLICLAVYAAFQTSQDLGAIVRTVGVTLLATLIDTGVTLFVLNQLLRPVLMTSRALRQFRETREVSPLPAEFNDEVGTLMADASGTIQHLDTMLEALEYRDEATGLPNRKRFLEMLASRLHEGQATAVTVIRIDNLGRIAESLDHACADQATRMLAARFALRSEFCERLSRVDAMHFACVMGARRDDKTPWVDALGRAKDALMACGDELTLAGVAIVPNLRAGICTFPEDGLDAAQLLDQAIAAAAQSTEQQPVAPHSSQARQAVLQRFTLEQQLRQAIKSEQFELAFQPVVNVQIGRAVGAEALIRWRHPERGIISPAEFIPVAESSGLIDPIGLWVLRNACAEVSRWNAKGHDRQRMAINLSARQFHDPHLLCQVKEALQAHRISPDQLEVELTETAAMIDHDTTRRVFAGLRDMGVGIAIDDFGTGYASMSYLRKLPFDKLKIDREFVTDVHLVQHNQAICGALIELSQGLGLHVLAEGTETEAEVQWLQRRGCELFQGYYFSRPIPGTELAVLMEHPGLLPMPKPAPIGRPLAGTVMQSTPSTLS